ncbi:MAG: NADP-dependent oxidoreductase [Candidatus Velthaea sp.]
MRGRQIEFVSRPQGMPTAHNFRLAEVDVPAPGAGEVLVRNTFMSVDPYMRGRMNDAKSYVPPFQIGKPLDGGAVGIVEQSNDPKVPVGTNVLHGLGFREYAVAPGKAFRPVDAEIAPASAYLGVLGMPAFTAYVGLFVVDRVGADDVVVISSAAGAVGSVAGQLAKRRGARVVGTTRSEASARILREKLFFDEVIVTQPGSMLKQLRDAAPDGVTFYFDNVGGELQEAAFVALRDFGRIAVCGMIANYNEPQPGPRTIGLIIPKRLKVQGFIVSDHNDKLPEFLADVGPAVARGEVVGLETFVEGLEHAPDALLSLFSSGSHVGKLIVRL